MVPTGVHKGGDIAAIRPGRERDGAPSPDGLVSVAEAIALLEVRYGSAATVREALLRRLTQLSQEPKFASFVRGPVPRKLSPSTYWRAATAYRTGRAVSPLLVLTLFQELEAGRRRTEEAGGGHWVGKDLLKSLKKQANLPAPTAPASPERGGWAPARRLAEASIGALREAERLDKKGAITLGEVYVARGCEHRLAKELLDGLTAREAPYAPQVIVGEAGTGKTSLLWKIADLVRRATDHTGRPRVPVARPTLIRGEDLFGSGAAASAHAEPVDQLRKALRQKRARDALIVLLDTADILLHDDAGKARCEELMNLCRTHRVPLAMTCRVREQHTLAELFEGEAYELTTLGDFRRGVEVRRAVTAYCDRYYRGRAQHERDTVREEILDAAVRGLPIREVVGRALTLRMLFEVYAPDTADAAQIPTREIDSDSVYELFWERRVKKDLRHGGSRIAAKEDLAPVAEALARQMLHDGKAHVTLANGTGVPRVLAEADPKAAVGLARLDGRGVLVGAGSRFGTVRFFHQTLYEYAAGRCLVTLTEQQGTKYYRMMENWLTAHPQDFLRAVVAERGIVQGARSDGAARGPALRLLRRLAGAEDSYLQTIALRAYAFLPEVLPGTDADLRELLRVAPDPMVTEFVGLLPTRHHLRPKRVTDDLAVVLRRSGKEMRRPVLEALCRFANAGQDAAFAVQGLLDGLCEDPDVCIGYRVDDLAEHADGQADEDTGNGWQGCRSASCLWSWLLNLSNQKITDHGNQAVRLVDAVARHLPGWAAVLMEQQIQLARERKHGRWLSQCIEPIDRHRDAAGWGTLLDRAARAVEQVGDPKAVRQRLRPAARGRSDGGGDATAPASDADGAEEQGEDGAMRILARHWARGSGSALTPARRLRKLAGDGRIPYATPWLPVRAQLTALGWMMRTEETGVADFLQEAVDTCQGTRKEGQIARVLLPQLLQPTGAPQEPGVRAAGDWCAQRLRLLTDAQPGTPMPPSVRFCAHGLSGLSPDIVRAIAEDAWGRAGRPWSDSRTDHVFLNEEGASALCVPLAAAGYGRATRALARWRKLEADRTAQFALGGNRWPRFRPTEQNPRGLPWQGQPRDRLVGPLHRALVRHAPHAHHLAGDTNTRVPSADMPWLTELADRTAQHPTASADGELFATYGTELAAWCQEVWKIERYPQPDNKHQALRLWRHLVGLRAVARPALREQAALLSTLRTVPERRAGLETLLDWNREGVSELAGQGGEDGWQTMVDGLDTMIHELGVASAGQPGARHEGGNGRDVGHARSAQGPLLSAAVKLRHLVLYRFASLTDPADRSRVIADAERQTASAARAQELTSVGFLVRRLIEVDLPDAVRLFIHVADAAVRVSAWGTGDGDGRDSGDSHDVESLVHHWRSLVYELVRTTDRDQFRRVVTGLARGPLMALTWVVDGSLKHRRDDDTPSDLERWLADSPYRDEVSKCLHSAGVRHRWTPLSDLLWAEILT
ncbi:NACHT domain-containing protein [Streptomyces sp. NPDC057307]|uniref:NACHT domain-containing protein n=1 Tax=Streptomyces sp. NPDC057307 TaxID=3346096 RepID=UPI00362554C7